LFYVGNRRPRIHEKGTYGVSSANKLPSDYPKALPLPWREGIKGRGIQSHSAKRIAQHAEIKYF
jgi:hypothetical protein